MNHLYKRTFDQVRMSEKSAADLRAELFSRSTHSETEEISMNKHHAIRRSSTFLVAAILIASLTISALACGIYNVVYKINSENDIPENAVTVDPADAAFESHDYNYTTDENGEIIVDFSGIALETKDVGKDVTYESVSGSDIPKDAEAVGLTEQDADFEFQNYSYTEENGEICVNLNGTN